MGRLKTGSEGSPPPWRFVLLYVFGPRGVLLCFETTGRDGTRRAFCPSGMLLVAKLGNPTHIRDLPGEAPFPRRDSRPCPWTGI